MNENKSTSLQVAPDASITAYTEQSASMMQQIATARIQSVYTMAARKPRDLEVVRQNILKECQRPSFCVPDESKNGSSLAIYRVPRGNVKDGDKWVQNNIEGPTIRFAEMFLRSWGYLSIEVVPLGEDDKHRHLQVICTDYQSCNFTSEFVGVPKSVERKKMKPGDVALSQRTNSYGDVVYVVQATDEELAMRTNALVSKARRNLILQAVPGWLIEEAVAQVRATARKKDAEDPDAAKRKLFDAFNTIGVSAAQLSDYLGHTGQLNPAELEDLRGYFSAIKEGFTTWAAIMAAKEDGGDDAEALNKKIEELFKELETPVAQMRKMKAASITDPQKLVEELEKRVAKKRNDGSAPAAKVEPTTEADTKTDAGKKEPGETPSTAATSTSTSTSAAPKTEPIKAAHAPAPAPMPVETGAWE